MTAEMHGDPTALQQAVTAAKQCEERRMTLLQTVRDTMIVLACTAYVILSGANYENIGNINKSLIVLAYGPPSLCRK